MEEMLLKLRYEWKVVSWDSHAKGYWELDEDTFDLRILRGREDFFNDENGDIYLTSEGGRFVIRLKDDESYYLINQVNENELSLTCYFKVKDVNQNNIEPIKLVTLRLSKEG